MTATAKRPPAKRPPAKPKPAPPADAPVEIVRCLSVPAFAAVLPGGDFDKEDDRKAGWAMLWRGLHAGWREATLAANLTLRLLAQADAGEVEYVAAKKKDAAPDAPKKRGRVPRGPVAPAPVQARIAKAEIDFTAIQREVRRRFRLLDPESLYAVTNAATKRYLSERLDVLSGRKSLPTMRYPQPVPVKGRDVTKGLSVAHGGRLVLDLRFPVSAAPGAKPAHVLVSLPFAEGDGAKKIELDYGRQLKPLREAAAGRLKLGGLTLRTDHRNRLILSFSIKMPVVPRDPGRDVEVMNVVTADDRAFVCEITGRGRPFYLNLDGLPDLAALASDWKTHLTRVQRMGEDLKAEKRWDANQRKNMRRSRERRCERMNRRVADALHKAAACIARHAAARKVHRVLYCDQATGFFGERFAYFKLRALVEQKLQQHGIAFDHVGAAEDAEEGKEAT